MRYPLTLAAAFVAVSSLSAQSTATVPPVCASLPGNAALSMPLRWSQGAMQVFVDAQLLPPALIGQTITGLRLRRSTLLGDTAYPALQRTLTVRGGFQTAPAAAMIGSLPQNRPSSAQVLFGPAVVSIAATPAPGPATTTGEEFLSIPFSIPLPVTAGTLYLEFEASDAPLMVGTGHWVDAVWFPGGADDGLVASVGDGSCTTRPEPTQLTWTEAHGPFAGIQAQVRVAGAPPATQGSAGLVVCWVGLDPMTTPVGNGYLGYGGSLGSSFPSMAGCHQWAPFDVAWFGTTDTTGSFATMFTIPSNTLIGTRVGVQAAWFDGNQMGVPLSFSNGLQLVCRSAGVGNHCNTFFFPGTATVSPWPPFVGQMPVLLLEY